MPGALRCDMFTYRKLSDDRPGLHPARRIYSVIGSSLSLIRPAALFLRGLLLLVCRLLKLRLNFIGWFTSHLKLLLSVMGECTSLPGLLLLFFRMVPKGFSATRLDVSCPGLSLLLFALLGESPCTCLQGVRPNFLAKVFPRIRFH